MPAKDHDIPIALVRQCFDLDPAVASGVRWRFRPDMAPQWNGKWAGKPAGSRMHKNYFQVRLIFGGRKRDPRTHRIVFALTHGHWPPDEVDHEKGANAGNGAGNLRAATHAENAQNKKVNSRNTSGYPGACWDRQHGRWRSAIQVDGRNFFLGLFATREQDCAAKKIVHPFAPSTRDAPLPNSHLVDRLKAAHRIVNATRTYPNMNLTAWQYLIPAL